MTTWHFHRNGKQEGPVTEDAFRQLVSSGQIRAGDLVWREGMQNWAPVETLAQAPQQAQPVQQQQFQPQQQFGPAPSAANQYGLAPQQQAPHGHAPFPQTGGHVMSVGAPKVPAKAYWISLVATWAIVALLTITVGLAAGRLASVAQSPEQIMAALLTGAGIVTIILYLAFYVAATVLYLAGACWQYHANVNLRVAQLQDAPSPFGSIFWWFIPLAHYVMPILSMMNTTKASSALANGRTDWRSEPTSGIFKAWAIAYAISSLSALGLWISSFAGATTAAGILLFPWGIAWIVASILLAILFVKITGLQERFVR